MNLQIRVRRHEECFLAIAVADCLSHAYLAGAFVVIPAVIQKVDTPIYCRARDSNRELLINVLQTKMPASQTDCRNFLAGASETSIDHHFTLLPSPSISRTQRVFIAGVGLMYTCKSPIATYRF